MANLMAYGEKVIGTTGSVVEWTQTQTTGTKIAEIDIDGTTTDVYAPSGGGGGSVNYSETEHVIGTWIDSKPLYEKTINFGALTNNTNKSVAHGIADVKTIIEATGYTYNGSLWVGVPYANSGNAAISIWCDATYVYIRPYNDRHTSTETYITLRYTKTTD